MQADRSCRIAFALAFAFATGVQATAATRAAACIPDTCPDPVRTFGEDAFVPGNLIRFEVRGVTPSDFELRTTEGELIPGRVHTIAGDDVFMPDEPVAETVELVLTYSYACSEASGIREPVAARYAFTATEHATIVLDTPQLQLYEEGTRYFLGGATGQPFKRYAVYTGLEYGKDHLIDHSVSIDSLPYASGLSSDALISLSADCDGLVNPRFSSCGHGSAPAPGRHEVVLHTHVVGESEQPPDAHLFVDLTCGASDDAAVPPAQALEEPTAPPVPAASCAVRVPRAGPGLEPAFALSMLASLAWRSRRSR